ncbi:beta-galactosidase [Micromonospora sp. CPCC 205371]|nr:beta-galactosidase [Micromonospora sp. CPCC 205371]
MSVQTIVRSGVELDARGIRIGGQPRLLLCASLFYFRLPREEWAARLAQVRASGYTCVDVYLPWNFHETAPGEWSFEGRRDVATFLDLAHAAGLYVIARPGPYICSEWDGGALPAWLGLDPQLRVRQSEPRYLSQVRAWFDQVLPLIAERQCTNGGPVIMVQLENELDFFDCADRTSYITALRDQSVDYGITVPMIACAGQGDLAGATGDVSGVVPACNFYPDDDSPHIEGEVRRYAGLLADRGLPLLVTETNRRHRTLRRLLASGASLIAPYLQSSGWNFGYTPSSGNWGAPGNLMSHGYDFGGYVSSTGVERPEFVEAQVLARVVDALGPRLALATSGVPRFEVTTDFPTSTTLAALDLDGGGQLLALPNLGAECGTATLDGVTVQVPADACPLVLIDVPLHAWGTDLTLALASADLAAVGAEDGRVALAFSSPVPVTVVLSGHPPLVIPVGTVVDVPGTAVTLVVLPPAEAARLTALHADGVTDLAPAPVEGHTKGATGLVSGQRRPSRAPAKAGTVHELPPALEALGVYRGRGTYTTTADLTGVDELLIVGAADMVDLSIAGQARPTIAGFGATSLVGVRDVSGPVDIRATVEIWGHANFDDDRLPALKLGALRGLGTVWTVEAVRDLSALWTVSGDEQWAGRPAPTRTLGGWSSTRVGLPVTYTRVIPGAGDSALHLVGLAEPVRVAVDGGEAVTVHPENPWLLLPASTDRVSVTMPHNPSGQDVRAELLSLRPVTGWSCTTEDDAALTAYANTASKGEAVELPVVLEAGEETWLDVELPPSTVGWVIRLEGAQIRATGWAAGECIGRVWLDDPRRPRFSGGDAEILWVPGAWAAAGTRLTLLLRGTAGPAAPALHAIHLEPSV